MDERTAKNIELRVEKILSDMGVKQPPLNLEDVLDFLDVHRVYYDLRDPGLLQEISHKLKIGLRKFTSFIEHIDLKGLWLPDQRKILIDQSTPQLKHRWITAHELGHRINPWHKEFFIGDTAETLDPDYHDSLEEEANYAASALLFMASRFSQEAADYELNYTSVSTLAKIYGNTQVTTLRRFVQFGRDKPMVAVISKPHWVNPLEESLCRYFIPSRKFNASFSKVTSSDVLSHIQDYTIEKSGGPVGGGEFILMDDNGVPHEFIGDSFFNQYDILTLIIHKRQYPAHAI